MVSGRCLGVVSIQMVGVLVMFVMIQVPGVCLEGVKRA